MKNKETRSSHYRDLTEEASKRKNEEATVEARQLESDDISEKSGNDSTSSDNDDWAEDKVSTSLDDE